MNKEEKRESWVEEAWELLLSKIWDNRPEGIDVVEYTKKDLAPILEKFPRSGQGEIRIFHSASHGAKALKDRDVMKVPISRSQWAIMKRPPKLELPTPTESVEFEKKNDLTAGMKAGLQAALRVGGTPGETMLLAIAKHVGIISDFYDLDSNGVMFTGGRQSAVGTHLIIGGKDLDLSKAQIEIDGAYEWAETIVIAEVKSSLEQDDFDVNQSLLPFLKWKGLVKSKTIYSMVLLVRIVKGELVYHVYDVVQDTSISPLGMKVSKSKKYVVKV